MILKYRPVEQYLNIGLILNNRDMIMFPNLPRDHHVPRQGGPWLFRNTYVHTISGTGRDIKDVTTLGLRYDFCVVYELECYL